MYISLPVHELNIYDGRILSWIWETLELDWACIPIQVTIYRRLPIGRDGHLDQFEAYVIGLPQLVQEFRPWWADSDRLEEKRGGKVTLCIVHHLYFCDNWGMSMREVCCWCRHIHFADKAVNIFAASGWYNSNKRPAHPQELNIQYCCL